MRRLLLIPLLAVFALLLAAGPAVARSAIDVDGEWLVAAGPEPPVVKVVGQNTILFGGDIITLKGDIEAEGHDEWVFVIHCRSQRNYYSGTVTLNAEVAGKTGMLTIKAFITQPQDEGVCDIAWDNEWSGRWFITGGTGELAGIRGHGRVFGPTLDLDYTGKVYLR